MEPNEPRSLDWKTCFKKILAPHLLNPSEEQNASLSLKPTNSKKQNDSSQIVVDLKNDSINTTAFLNNPEKYEQEYQHINSSSSVEFTCITSYQPFIDSCQNSDSSGGKLNDAESHIETEQNVAYTIAADAEELSKSFTALKVKKRNKYFHNRVENSRNAPDWNVAFKKVLDPKSVSESPSKTPEEFMDDKPYLSTQELLDSQDPNQWLYHTLCKKDEHLENFEEVRAQKEKMKKERHYTDEEKKVLEVLRKAGTFVCPPKPHINVFDGAGVNCFKDNEKKQSTRNKLLHTEKPKNVPPPGGWVCIKPLSLEEIRSRPINVIATECWDWDEYD